VGRVVAGACSNHVRPNPSDRPGPRVLLLQVPEGTRVQLQVRDWALQREQARTRLEAAAEQLPLGLMQPSLPSSLGLLCFSCAGVPHSDAEDLCAVLPQTALGGGRCQGEFGRAGRGPGPPRLHSFASSMTLLQPVPASHA